MLSIFQSIYTETPSSEELVKSQRAGKWKKNQGNLALACLLASAEPQRTIGVRAGASSAQGAFYDRTPDWTLIEHLLWPQLCYRGMQRAWCHTWSHQYSYLVTGIWCLCTESGEREKETMERQQLMQAWPVAAIQHVIYLSSPKTHMKTSKDAYLYFYEGHIMNTYKVIRTLMEACQMLGSRKWKLWGACKFYVSCVT